jgi:hypothetical protein
MTCRRSRLKVALLSLCCLLIVAGQLMGVVPDAPTVLEPFEPAQDEALINFHPHFQWKGPEMTLDYQPECEIQVATDKDFREVVISNSVGGGMNRFYSTRSLTELRDYYWRVRLKSPQDGPWSAIQKFTLVAPEKRFDIARGSDASAVLKTLRSAAAYAKSGHTVEVVFEKGDYQLGSVDRRPIVQIEKAPGFRVEGNGSTLTMADAVLFADVAGSRNVEIRQLTMKWSAPGHVMLEVTKVLPETREIEAAILPEYPVKDLEKYWPASGNNTFLIKVHPEYPGKYLGGFRAGTPRVSLGNGAYRIGADDARFKADWTKSQWKVGDRIAATHYRPGFIQNHDNDKLVLKDVVLIDSPGAISGNGGRNDKVAYLNVDVMPDPRLPASRLGGHASSEGGRIAAWIEECDFHLLGDDNYNTGYFFDYELVSQSSESDVVLKIQPWDELIFKGDRLRFSDRKANRQVAEAVVLSVDSSVKDQVSLRLDRPLGALPPDTIASNNHGTQRFVYRKNRQYGGRGHGLKFKGYGALIEDNVFENVVGIGIYLGCPEGPQTIARSADMVTVRRNVVKLCGWNSMEAGHDAARSERLRFEDNVIRDSKEAGIVLVNIHGALIARNRYESVTRCFDPGKSYPTLRTKMCEGIKVSDEVIVDARARAGTGNIVPSAEVNQRAAK